MTRDDIINAAFTVWGQELYKTTSLSMLAETLGVSKSALYRHFPDKESLLKTMEICFYDEYAAAIKPVFDKALAVKEWQERVYLLAQAITAYFARNFNHFIYSLLWICEKNHHHVFLETEMNARGVSFTALEKAVPADKHYPPMELLVRITAMFETGMFHKRRWHGKAPPVEEPSEEELLSFSALTAHKVCRGLGFDRAVIDALAFLKLEKCVAGISAPSLPKAGSADPLLKTVAEVVAERGPWNASMETVAKRSGLSKSGLYAHFKSKRDMLSRLVVNEMEQLGQITAACSFLKETGEERLYLALLAIAGYMKTRPEILIVLDWARILRVELDLSVPPELCDFFAGLKLAGPADSDDDVMHWILMLVGAVLLKDLYGPSSIGTEGLRKLFRFITLGINGFDGKKAENRQNPLTSER